MARQATLPNAENCSLAELETAMKCSPRLPAFVRMQAIRALLTGFTHQQVADLSQKTRGTIVGWVKRFNESGIDGLIDQPRSGRPRAVTPEQSAQYQDLIDHPDRAGQTHWTARKFHGHIRDELEHEVGYSTIVRWLRHAGYRLKVPQPWPDRQDEEARQAFVEQVRAWLQDSGIDLWYMDETGIEGDPRPRRRWIQRGEKGRVTKNGDHIRMNVAGMVCPRTGQFYALEFTHSDSEVFQTFLNHANADTRRERPRNLLICDNASWHKRKSTDWGAFEPVFLPAYSPDLNPIERLWLLLKAEWFTDFVAKTREALVARLDQALRWLIGREKGNVTTCAIKREL
jgi:transposase